MAENGKTSATRLGEIWNRLDALCLRLWHEDRIAAVGLQAVIEEYKGEIARAEQMLSGLQKALGEQRQTLESSFNQQYQSEKTQWTERHAALERQVKSLEDSLAQERARSEDFRKKLETTERAYSEFKETALKKEAELDTSHSAHLRGLLDEMEKREARMAEGETDLRRKANTLEDRIRELETAYQKKNQELDKFKDEIRAEMTRAIESVNRPKA